MEMKTMKTMKTILNGFFAVAALSASSMALAETPDSSALDYYKPAVEALSQNMLNSAIPASRVSTLKVDEVTLAFSEMYKTDYFPVFFSGSYYVASKDGDVLSRPSGFYVFDEGKRLLDVGKALTPIVTAEILKKKDVMVSHALPKGVDKKGDLYLVTDPTCGYCKKVESDLDYYLHSGIVVHYIPFPRSGVTEDKKNLPAYTQWKQAVCNDITTPAKAYKDIALGDLDTYRLTPEQEANCDDSIIAKGHQSGMLMGVLGTPYMHIKMDGGKELRNPGYLPYSVYEKELGLSIQEIEVPAESEGEAPAESEGEAPVSQS
jgi:thiol:disulfide interchange protein DsbC